MKKQKMYIYIPSHAEVLALAKDDNGHAKVRDFVGKEVFEEFMKQINILIDGAGVELANFNVAFIPFANTYHIQDVTFRYGGSRTITTAKSIYNSDVKYDCLWEHL
jgi:hypothetical protein